MLTCAFCTYHRAHGTGTRGAGFLSLSWWRPGIRRPRSRRAAALAGATEISGHPSALGAALGPLRIRELTLGELLKRGYTAYWQRYLDSTRQIFRFIMKQGYGTLNDWKYMQPSILPASCHRWLVGLRDGNARTTDGKS